MIQWMKVNNNKMSPILWIIIVAFVGTAFVGINNYNPYLAKIKEDKIQSKDLYYFSQNKGYSINDENQKMILSEAVNEYIYINLAKDLGFGVTKKDIKKSLSSYKEFQVDGVFSFEKYSQVLKSKNINMKDFENNLSNLILSNKLDSFVKRIAPSSKQKEKYKFKKESVFKYKVFYPKYEEIKEASIEDYYSQNSFAFKSKNIKVKYETFDYVEKDSLSLKKSLIKIKKQLIKEKMISEDDALYSKLKNLHSKGKKYSKPIIDKDTMSIYEIVNITDKIEPFETAKEKIKLLMQIKNMKEKLLSKSEIVYTDTISMKIAEQQSWFDNVQDEKGVIYDEQNDVYVKYSKEQQKSGLRTAEEISKEAFLENKSIILKNVVKRYKKEGSVHVSN